MDEGIFQSSKCYRISNFFYFFLQLGKSFSYNLRLSNSRKCTFIYIFIIFYILVIFYILKPGLAVALYWNIYIYRYDPRGSDIGLNRHGVPGMEISISRQIE